MSGSSDGTRRATVALDSGSGRAAVPKIGSRSLHQYWALLMPHFRGILLPPQFRSDEAVTHWSWREPIASPPLTGAEIAAVRKRLASAQLSLADSAEDAPASSASDSRKAAAILPQVQARMSEVVAGLAVQPDSILATYIVRSERGLMLHSWGLAAALKPYYPDSLEIEISGTVLVAGKPASGHEVRLENPDGASLNRMRSDADGRFRFPKISPGRYRVHVHSEQIAFSAEGLTVDLDHTSLTNLELHDARNGQASPSAPAAQNASSASRRRTLFVLLGLAALATAGGTWWWLSASRHTQNPPPSPPSVIQSPTTARAPSPAGTPPTPQTSSAPFGSIHSDGRFASTATATTPLSRSNLPLHGSVQPRATNAATLNANAFAPDPAGTPNITASGSATTSTPNSPSTTSSAAPDGASPANNSSALSNPAGVASSIANAGAGSTANPSAPATTAVAEISASPTAKSPIASPAAIANPATTSAHATSEPTAPAADSSRMANVARASTNPSAPIPADSPPTIALDLGSAAEKTSAVAKPTPATSDQTPSHPSNSAPSKSVNNSASTVSSAVAPPPNAETNDPALPGQSAAAMTSPVYVHQLKIHVGTWQPRLLRDSILPTQPTRIGEDDALDLLRERRFRDRKLQIPVSFKNPAIQCGFVIEFSPPSSAHSDPPHWRISTGGSSVRATILGNRAEIAWNSTASSAIDCTLVSIEGRERARAIAEPHTTATLQLASDAEGWPWIGLARAPADNAVLTTTEWTDRLSWRMLNNTSLPTTWLRDDRWLAGQGLRLDFIASPHVAGEVIHFLALVDRLTGWSIAGEVTLTSDRP